LIDRAGILTARTDAAAEAAEVAAAKAAAAEAAATAGGAAKAAADALGARAALAPELPDGMAEDGRKSPDGPCLE
jgi:hypothetical protein